MREAHVSKSASGRTRTTPEDRIGILLPAEYRQRYEEIQPVSMGSAGLKYGRDGKVAWDQIWGSFCDLAMAGGPPHKGALLEPGSEREIEAQPERYKEVVAEICRGIRMVTDLAVSQSSNPGWVSVGCDTSTMANWLARAIVMENVSAWFEAQGPPDAAPNSGETHPFSRDSAARTCASYSRDSILELPASPGYRLEKEIKNVITSIAKTNHYFAEHLRRGQQREIQELFAEMDAEAALVQPAVAGHGFDPDKHHVLSDRIASRIREATGLSRSEPDYAGWLGIAVSDAQLAIRMMRLLATFNVVARRQEAVLYVPINPSVDPNGELVGCAVTQVFHLTR